MFREPEYKTNDDVSSITIPKSLAAQVGSLKRITFYILPDTLFYKVNLLIKYNYELN